MRYHGGFYWARYNGRGPMVGFRDFYAAVAWLWGFEDIQADCRVN
jgi:hypothetical protein